MATTYRILAWKDIPSLVQATDGSTRVKRELPEWFAQEIDRVAMRDGLQGSDDYMAHMAWSKPAEREGTPEEVADAVLAELLVTWGRPPA
jgi:hypothetical protein